MNTPYFLINVDKIDALLNDMKTSFFDRWIDGIIGYSFKTNNFPWIISYMKDNGLWAETVSADEYQLAIELGYEPDKIIFNGPVKDKDTFIYAVKNKSIVNIDSKRELEWLLEMEEADASSAVIGLRVNYCIEEDCPNESQCGSDDGRFGFSYEEGELEDAIASLRNAHIKISGLHMHCSSKTRSVNIYRSIAERAVEIVNKYNLELDYIDIGGGFFGGVAGKPTFSDYFSTVSEILDSNEKTKDLNLIIEPGMSLIGASMDYHTSVIDVKKTKNNSFVVTDGSRTHIDPLMKKSSYTYHINRKDDAVCEDEEQIIAGFTCMEGDRFFKYTGLELKVGDEIVYEKVGAYTMGLSPQFIEFYPAVYVNQDDEKILVRKKVTARQFIDINKA